MCKICTGIELINAVNITQKNNILTAVSTTDSDCKDTSSTYKYI